MKTIQLIAIFCILFIFSCKSKSNVDEANTSTNTNADAPQQTKDTTQANTVITLANPIWKIEQSDDGEKFIMTNTQVVDSNVVVTPELIINTLNAKWPKVKMVLSKVSKDTAYVSIPDSEYITQRMGSSGAENYLVNVIYNITEAKGIQYINLDLVEGDHLMPGVYSRKDFKDKVVKAK